MKKFLKTDVLILTALLTLSAMAGCNQKKEFNQETFMNDILPVIDCLYSCDEELFGADVDLNTCFSAAYKDDGGNLTLEQLYPEGENLPDGFVQDPAYAQYYPVKNFKSIDEVRKSLGRYMTEDVIDKTYSELINEDFLEYDGGLYLCRGGRGYGALFCSRDTLVYTGEKNGMQKVKIDYTLFDEYSHTSILSFKNTDEGWKIAEIKTSDEAVG